MVISLSSSKHWEGCGVGVNFSFSETQVKTAHAHDTKLMQIMSGHIRGKMWQQARRAHGSDEYKS